MNLGKKPLPQTILVVLVILKVFAIIVFFMYKKLCYGTKTRAKEANMAIQTWFLMIMKYEMTTPS